jgi:tRNA threonylcarbamoyladenosine biosynthesis protein TsaE
MSTEPPAIPDDALTLQLSSLAATDALAQAIAPVLRGGWHVHLSGDLGAGKTRFTRALLASLGHHGRVRSPTFTLAEPYNLSNFDLYHFDFYRLTAAHDWQDAGFDEILADPRIVSVIEWPQRAEHTLPAADLHLHWMLADGASPLHDMDAEPAEDQPRTVRLYAGTPRGRQCVSTLAQAVAAQRVVGVSSARA